ncbi:MAG: Mannose-phosphate guanylyltransferase [Oscillospiraceae bacterium]|jgi:mannose-1-phosphate guanylyltransferase|nr:Mannose-phosphate guanylyltransferase [Oscillospiraceae bacterium]
MYTVLLSGGSGKRLWPLSNDLRSKQYIKLLHKENCEDEKCSMVQRVWDQLEKSGLLENSIITASTSQIEVIRNQLGQVNIAVEPSRRDTFPAVALSCAYLKTKLGAKDEDVVCVFPVDPYTEKSFFEKAKSLEKILYDKNADVALMGAKPTYASSKYGYIIPDETYDDYVKVKEFKEKPTEQQAETLIEQGAIWNCGVFCFKISKVLDRVKQYGVSTDYWQMYKEYDKLPKISFDYEVLEKEKNLAAVCFDGFWKDLGTWNTLAEQMSTNTFGNVFSDDTCENTQVINKLNIPVVTMGTKDMVVVASFDGILVSDKHQSSYIKKITEDFDQPVMYEERRWGTIKKIDVSELEEDYSLIRKIMVFAGENSSYHFHKQRDEVWTVLKGEGELILDTKEMPLSVGSVITIKKNQRHAVRAITDLEFIEIHIGGESDVLDTSRIAFEWDEIKGKIETEGNQTI